MRIAINMSTLRGSGSSMVGMNLLKEIELLARDHYIEAWIPSSWGWHNDNSNNKFKLNICNSNSINKFFIENICIRKAIVNKQFDCLFSLGDTTLPFCTVPNLLMVHQAYLA